MAHRLSRLRPAAEPRQRRGCGALLLAALALLMAPPAAGAEHIDRAKAVTVTIVTVEYRFEPDRLVFRRGVPYRLRIVDRGRELHELTAPKFFAAIEMRDPAALNPERSEIVVRPGEVRDLYFLAPKRGHFAMWCADHDWAGMTGEITIK